MITLIDNQDSFVYTLARYIELCGMPSTVLRSDDFMSLPDGTLGILISPGPMSPHEMPVTNAIIKRFASKMPILGVCLGHQCIGHVFGARIYKSVPVHGKTSEIYHDNDTLFANIPSPTHFTRYHSLSVKDLEGTELRQTAWTEDGVVMGLKHKDFDCYGVQFHPESVLSEHGLTLIKNFLSKCSEHV